MSLNQWYIAGGTWRYLGVHGGLGGTWGSLEVVGGVNWDRRLKTALWQRQNRMDQVATLGQVTKMEMLQHNGVLSEVICCMKVCRVCNGCSGIFRYFVIFQNCVNCDDVCILAWSYRIIWPPKQSKRSCKTSHLNKSHPSKSSPRGSRAYLLFKSNFSLFFSQSHTH